MRLLTLAPIALCACTWVGQAEWDQANDRDRDGYLAAANGGDDCDDGDAAVHPGADERCDDVDQDCDGETDEDPIDASSWFPDIDSDGFGDHSGAILGCEAPDGWIADGTDCDDGNFDIHPGADERCNEVDDDCDGETDEDPVDGETWYQDQDADGHGIPEDPIEACALPDGYAATPDDCDDGDPGIHPDATEWLDGADQDCDGTTDNLDAAASAGWLLRGTLGHARAGEGSQGRADYNGDGHADLVVSAPGAATDDRVGLLGLWWGGSLTLEGESTTDDWTPDVMILGGEAAAMSFPVRGLAALEGEAATLVVAVRGGDASSCHLFQQASLSQAALTTDDASVVLEDCGGGEPWQLTHGGDHDGDGYDDLPLLPDPTSGVWVLAGRADNHWNSLNNKSATDQAELAVSSVTGGDDLVISLEGDLDGDGCDDLLVGDSYDDESGVQAGALFLLYGDPTALDGNQARALPDDADARLLGHASGHLLGQAVTASDLNGDGYAELFVAAAGPEGRTVYLLPGANTQLSGVMDIDSAGAFRWSATVSQGAPGWGLSAGEDIDGDGVPDVLVTSGIATPDAGRAWLLSGVNAFAGLDLDADATMVSGMGEPAGSNLAADLDGDGSGELLLCDPQDDTHGVQSGALFLVPGYR